MSRNIRGLALGDTPSLLAGCAANRSDVRHVPSIFAHGLTAEGADAALGLRVHGGEAAGLGTFAGAGRITMAFRGFHGAKSALSGSRMQEGLDAQGC